MAHMTRTQLSLQEEEYLFLKARAAETNSSLSSVVRGLVRSEMQRADAASPRVWEIAGLFADGEISGTDHDAVLYGIQRDEGVPEREPER